MSIKVTLELPDEPGYVNPRFQEERTRFVTTGYDERHDLEWLVSTVYLGTVHGNDMIYETLYRWADWDDVAARYQTKLQALYGHKFWVEFLEWASVHVEHAYPTEKRVAEEGDEYIASWHHYGDLVETYKALHGNRHHHAIARSVCCDGELTFRKVHDPDSVLAAPKYACKSCGKHITEAVYTIVSLTEDT